jgi:hypothetical protein
MMWKLALVVSCLGLAGCASTPGTDAVATCTDLISTSGGMLKYCQTGNKIEATESGIDSKAEPAAVKVVDDPEVLQGLQKQAGLHPELMDSRKLVARACVAGGVDYLSVSVKDLKRMLSDRMTARPETTKTIEEPVSSRAGA